VDFISAIGALCELLDTAASTFVAVREVLDLTGIPERTVSTFCAVPMMEAHDMFLSLALVYVHLCHHPFVSGVRV